MEKLVSFRIIKVNAPLWVTDSVSGARTEKQKVKEYLVRWDGFGEKHASYIQEEFISPVCIVAFNGGTSLTVKPLTMLAMVPELKYPSSSGYEVSAHMEAWSQAMAGTHDGKSKPSKWQWPLPVWRAVLKAA